MDKVVKDHTYHTQIRPYSKYLLLHQSHPVIQLQPVLTTTTHFFFLVEMAYITSSFILKQNLLYSKILLIILHTISCLKNQDITVRMMQRKL
jgi:hypothetical protein